MVAVEVYLWRHDVHDDDDNDDDEDDNDDTDDNDANCSGQAKILMEPSKHQKQYPHLWPFEVGTDIYAQEFEWLRYE